MAGHGGARPGAGRPSDLAKYGWSIALVKDAIAENSLEIFEKGMELVRGVEVEGADGKVYSRPPDAKMIAFFLERLMGKAPQSIELTGQDGGPVAFDLRLLPTEDLVSLERIARRLADGGPPGTAERN